jgi:4-hydroxy-2-oxoheptanedioate aldolase
MPYHALRGFRSSLLNGEPKFGLLALSGSAQLVEMGGFLGLDFVVLDMEHTDGVGISEMLHLIRAADGAGLPAVVRVPRSDPSLIQRVLDFGAAGICVPHVSSAADAQCAVAAAKYPPDGSRSTCPYIRASEYGGKEDVAAYAAEANRETLVMALVEDRRGMNDLDAILAVPGLDAVLVGSSDLARDLGLPGTGTHPEIEKWRRHTAEAARRHGVVASITISTSLGVSEESRAAEIEKLLAEGFTMFMWQDTSVFREAVLGLRRAYRGAGTPVGANDRKNGIAG